MRTEHAPTIQRADYQPLPWTVDTVDLHFRLDAEATLVTNRMRCVRNRDAAEGPIRLWSEALERVSLTVDGEAPAALREMDGGVSYLLPPTPVPTLSEWAMILFAGLMATGAALYLQRRRSIG